MLFVLDELTFEFLSDDTKRQGHAVAVLSTLLTKVGMDHQQSKKIHGRLPAREPGSCETVTGQSS